MSDQTTDTPRGRADAVIRDVQDGRDTWSRLHARGHNFMTVSGCVARGELAERWSYHYALTEAGKARIDVR